MTIFSVWQQAAIFLVLSFTLARMLEVLSSKAHTRAATLVHGAPPARPREPWWPLIVATHVVVLGGSAAHIVLVGNMPARAVVYAAGTVLGLAIVLRAWIFVTLRNRWNVRVVDPGSIVTDGPYRYLRHPNYLAVILEIAALPVAVGAYEVAILGSIANAIVLSWRIPFEERMLMSHARYRDVMMKRPRLFPHL
jgi:methyltransferase